jgi:hypothetical protein
MVPSVVQIILWSRTLAVSSRVIMVTGFVTVTMSATASPAESASSVRSSIEIRGMAVESSSRRVNRTLRGRNLVSRSFAYTLRSLAAVEEVGHEPARIFGVVEPEEVTPIGQNVEFAVRHEGGYLPSSLDAAERVTRARGQPCMKFRKSRRAASRRLPRPLRVDRGRRG